MERKRENDYNYQLTHWFPFEEWLEDMKGGLVDFIVKHTKKGYAIFVKYQPIKECYKSLRLAKNLSIVFIVGQLIIGSAFSEGVPMNYDKLLATLIGEAVGEGEIGMQAVSEVIRSRMANTGESAENVVMKPMQFSFWNNPVTAQAFLEKNYEKYADSALRAWNNSEKSNMTGGALNYHANWLKKYPYWSKKMKETARIGKHIFYK